MDKEIKPLNVDIKMSTANGKVYEMVDYEEYSNNPNKYLGRGDIGISVEHNGKTLLLPLKDEYVGNPISPGIYNAGLLDYYVYPDEIIEKRYVPEKIIRIGNKMDAAEIIKSGEEINHLDESFITTPDNITQIPIQEEDQPEMKCLKTALNDKAIDIDKYAARFGDNFPNDKRQLKNNSVTLNILKRFCKHMDMEAVLTLKDKSSDVPNPIGHDVTVSLTDGFEDED